MGKTWLKTYLGLGVINYMTINFIGFQVGQEILIFRPVYTSMS